MAGAVNQVTKGFGVFLVNLANVRLLKAQHVKQGLTIYFILKN